MESLAENLFINLSPTSAKYREYCFLTILVKKNELKMCSITIG